MLKKNPYIFAICLSFLLIPFIGMQLTDSIEWSLLDFAVMGILLFGLGSGIQWAREKIQTPRKKQVFVGLLILTFLLVWAELAVGILGTPFAGN
ncbi:MAG: hypothetical protein ISP68_01590 [Flavobacteriaceae bacterium]|jgi:hypothetical protein|nr:hypothetical protein [Flavobacteriaceae bacterium]